MRTNRRSLALAVLISLTPALFPQRSFAQAAPAAPDPTLQAAHARFAEGVDFYDKGDYENARAAFLQAYALHKHPAVLINLAQSSLRSGHTLDADRYFTRYIHESASLTPAQRAEAEAGLTEARTKLGRIDVLAPSGVAVTVDTELAGTDGSTTIDVEPGVHQVKGGGDTSSVTVTAGQTVMVKLGKGGAPPPVVAPLPTPDAPAAPPPVAPAPAVEPPPPPPADAQKPGILSPPATLFPVLVGAGIGFAGFVTAIILGVSKGNAQDQYNTESTDITNSIQASKGNPNGACVNPSAKLASGCAALNSDGNDVSTDATVANIGVVVGIVGVGFAAGWYLFAPKREAKPASAAWHPTFQPLIGPHVRGGTFGVEF